MLRSNPSLRRLLAAWAQSCLGTGAGYVALLLLTYRYLHTSWAIAAVLLADFLPAIAFACATIYGLSYIPTLVRDQGHTLADIINLQQTMFYYHSHVTGTHPYMSTWWQWPIMQVPIVYYYEDFRHAADAANATACCLAEIIALPNPAVFLLGLVSVPFVAWLAWRERNKGYALLALTYGFQWVPWMRSPRMLWHRRTVQFVSTVV